MHAVYFPAIDWLKVSAEKKKDIMRANQPHKCKDVFERLM